MLITKEIDYALRIISALASGRHLTAGEICRQELAPQQFGYKILKKLEKGGLIQITRGSEGGCRLACDLREVTLYDLIRIMEAEGWVSACMDPEFKCARREQNENRCRIHEKLAGVQQKLNQELKKSSLYEIVDGRTVE